jgi:hypothetical protein
LTSLAEQTATLRQLNQTKQEGIDRIDYIPITLQELSKLPFDCEGKGIGPKCCITDIAGRPRHPATLQEMPFMPFQKRFKNTVDNTTYHKFHVNKGRQMGFSELILRIFQERGFKQYAKKSCKYVVGTREKTTKKMIGRLKELYKKIPDVVENNHDSLYLELKDGTNFEGLAASPEAVTGDTKIAAVAMDEAPKWNLIDDTPVLNAYVPIIRTNKSDFFLFGTPKGPRGFFYEIDMTENDYMKFKYSIWETENYLYTTEEIKTMLADPTMDANQEYLNQYTTGLGSIFPSVDDYITDDKIKRLEI